MSQCMPICVILHGVPSLAEPSMPVSCLLRLAGQYSKGIWRVPMLNYSALLQGFKSVPGVNLTVEALPTAADVIVKVIEICMCCSCSPV